MWPHSILLLLALWCTAGTLLAAPLSSESTDAVEAQPSTRPDAVLAPLREEQEAANEEALLQLGLSQLLATDIDSRGPTWAHNAARVNAAEHPPRLDDQAQLETLLRNIEASAQAREQAAAPAATRSVRVDNSAQAMVELSDNLFRHMPRAVVQWVKENRIAVTTGSVVLLLLGWAAMALVGQPDRRRQWHRRRGTHDSRPGTPELPVQVYRRRRTHRRSPESEVRRVA